MKRACLAIAALMLFASCASDDCFFHDDWCDASRGGETATALQD